MEGLGDVIEIVTVKTGIKKLAPKNCNCQKRRQWLNKKVPFKTNSNGSR